MTVVFLEVGVTSWTVPAGVTTVKVEALGAGGNASSANRSGGAGGAYARVNALAVTPGEVLTVQVPSPTSSSVGTGQGTDCRMRRGGTDLIRARSARQPTANTAIAIGGQDVDCVGDVVYSGGNSGGGPDGAAIAANARSGGGGAAGPNGQGGNGGSSTSVSYGGGGGGANGGGHAPNQTGSSSGPGGTGPTGSPGGTPGAGRDGMFGSGGAGDQNSGGQNSHNAEWDANHGSGSGAGSRRVSGAVNSAGCYGGGAGGNGAGTSSGDPGLIVVTYNDATPSPINGTSTVALGPLTSTSGAKLALQAMANKAFAPMSSVSTAKLLLRGQLSKTLGAMTATGRIGSSAGATLAKTLGAMTVSATGASPRRAQLAKMLGSLTSISAAKLPIVGRTSGDLAHMVSMGSAKLSLRAQLTTTLGAMSVSAFGRFLVEMVTPDVRIARVLAENRSVIAVPSNRTVYAIEGNTMLIWPDKDPNEVLEYKIDWSAKLEGDTIVSSDWFLPDGLIGSRYAYSDTETEIWLSEGVNSRRLVPVLNRVTTVAGRTMDQTVYIKIHQK